MRWVLVMGASNANGPLNALFHNLELRGIKSRGSFTHSSVSLSEAYFHKAKITNSHIVRYMYATTGGTVCQLSNMTNGGDNSVQYTSHTNESNGTGAIFIRLGSVTNIISNVSNGTSRIMNANDCTEFYAKFNRFGDLLTSMSIPAT